MRACFSLAVASVLACCSVVAAQTPDPGDAAKALAGTWEFTNADRDKTCTITLRTDPAPGGMRAQFDTSCAAKFPFIAEVTAWTMAENDFLRLVDAKGSPILEFSEVESGIYEAPRPGEGILFIQNAGAAGPAPRTAAEVAGEWSVVRGGGKTVCTLTLTNTPSGDDFAVRVGPPCDPFVSRFVPATWQVERGELVLKGTNGPPWRFEESDAKIWQRVPATADPVLLVRK